MDRTAYIKPSAEKIELGSIHAKLADEAYAAYFRSNDPEGKGIFGGSYYTASQLHEADTIWTNTLNANRDGTIRGFLRAKDL